MVFDVQMVKKDLPFRSTLRNDAREMTSCETQMPFIDNLMLAIPMCFSLALSLPRRGPGFQFRMLRRVCSRKRSGKSLLKRYIGLGEECPFLLRITTDGHGLLY